MTRLALIAALAMTAIGGGDGAPTHIREQRGVESGDSVLRALRAGTAPLPVPNLVQIRIHWLARERRF